MQLQDIDSGVDFLRQDIIKYGELAQITYDVLLSKDPNSPSFGSSRLSAADIFGDQDDHPVRKVGRDTLHFSSSSSTYKVCSHTTLFQPPS